MASSFSTLSLAPSLPPMKYIPYVPLAHKPKTKSKAKAKPTPKITDLSLGEAGNPEYDGEWADIDDFSTDLADTNASRSLDPGLPAAVGADGPSGSPRLESEGDLSTVPPPQIAQSQQPGQAGPDKAAGVEVMDLAVDGLFDGSSPEFPLALDDNAAGASHSIDDVQSSGGLREYQDDDLDAAGMRAFSVENTGGVYNYSFPEQDEPCDDVGMRNRPSATRKRKYALFDDTITSSVEVLDHTSRPDSEDSRSAKRRLAQPQAESYTPSPVYTPMSTPPPDCGSQVSSLKISNDPNPGFPDGGGKGNSTNIPDLPRSDFDSVDGADGEHDGHGSDMELPEPLRQSISPSRRMEGDRRVNLDLYVGEDKNDGSDGEIGESDEDELNCDEDELNCDEDELNCDEDEPRRASTATFQRRKPSNRPFQDSRRGPSRTGLKRQSRNTMPTRTLRQPKSKSSPSRLHSRPKADIVTPSASLRTFSPVTRAVHDRGTSYRPSDYMNCWPTDITLYQVPKCTRLVTAIVRCHEITSKLSLKPLPIVRDLLGDAGQLLRMTQVTSNSWLLVGCRYNYHNAPNLRAGRSWTQPRDNYASPKTDICRLHGNGTSYDVVDSNNEGNGDDGFEGCGESSGDSESDAGFDDDDNDEAPPDREHRRVYVRTREPWSKSDEQRLLAYRHKMGMKWDDIFPLFPNRTAGAVQARWYVLQGK
ncbi:hypothetical protein K469DRAFT_341777 [Zopfia rhizophila CBS 207.26]|uniref:Uncharacterized protein n=1 Tax=Zopfia rhizophila CBS 207.26 TaxID=1314779 RepID=A0A6A6ENU8_9PEZI|nr:hypothetical protein K469DRAFT_341777 [Zopfia rhizophila CBS 207.26]